MALESMKDVYLDELGDLYDAEAQSIRTLHHLSERAKAPELREALAVHCRESRLHMERLQLIFTHWGQPVSLHSCAGVAGIVQEADDRLNQLATADVRDAAIVSVACRIEHYEIAGYECARLYARRLNRPDEARLLQESLDDETRADRRLIDMFAARAGGELNAGGERADPQTADEESRAAPRWPAKTATASARARRSVTEPRSQAANRSTAR
jgi:ferritin-like metal-binding protein YciE